MVRLSDEWSVHYLPFSEFTNSSFESLDASALRAVLLQVVPNDGGTQTARFSIDQVGVFGAASSAEGPSVVNCPSLTGVGGSG